jgi:Rieske 2Fe-2S family protein
MAVSRCSHYERIVTIMNDRRWRPRVPAVCQRGKSVQSSDTSTTAEIAVAPSPGGSLVATLPGRSYTDPAIFAREQEAIFESTWFCAVRAADIPDPGQLRVVTVGRESLLVVRHPDGSLRAFLNVCRHRGARLCIEESGQVKRTIRCAYHAWAYDLTGRLAAAPNLARMTDIDRDAYGLIKVALREWLGYAWICLADSPPSFEDAVVRAVADRLGGPEVIERYQVARLALGHRITYNVAANWKLIIENFMECYHCATIHPELTGVLPEFAGGYAVQYYSGHGAAFATRTRGFTIDGGSGFGALPGISPQEDRRYFAITVRPQVFINLVPDHVILHRLYPHAADQTTIVCDWLFDPRVIETGQDVTRSVELFDRVNRQDFDACERTQPSMTSRAYTHGGVLVPSEHHITDFHEWVNSHS